MPSSQAVADEYTRCVQTHRIQVDQEQIRFRWIGNARLLAGLTAAALAFFVFGSAHVPIYWLALPLAALVILVVYHAQVVERLQRARRAVAYYERALARVYDRWKGTGQQGDQFRDPNHVYADDLDIFGNGSLYELLCTARTHSGEHTLAEWLLSPASPDEVLGRQAAVAELARKLELREELALAGEDVRAGIRPERLEAWGQAAAVRFPPALRILAVLLSAGTLISLVGLLSDRAGRVPLLVFVLVQMGVSLAMRPRIRQVVEAVELPSHDLALLSEMLERIEREPAACPLLVALKNRLKTEGLSAAEQIAHLERLATRLEWSHNEFFKPIAAALMWSTHIAVAIETWRSHSGPAIPRWIAATGEFEALSALATYHYEHPGDPFPELSAERGLLQGEGLGHPLLSTAQSVPNDLELSRGMPLVIVSGSNMSGKSTLLRTVGLNTVLAWAGAPVRARRLLIAPLQVGASIRVQDSLQDGRSRFYAEITRLRRIVDLTAADLPVLFLLDELLSGTNSHDREIGAAAIVKSLIERGATGLMTTHDLALAHIAESVRPSGLNVHFADTIDNGQLHFDYQLHPGIVERSNALELMRSVGLDV